MTFGYGPSSQPDGWSEAVLSNKEAEDCLLPMGITSENVAAEYGISRERQDDFAAKSFQKAAAAQKAGKFKDEILPIKVKITDPKTETEKEIVVDADDGIRAGVTAESLAKLKPVFSKTGSTHAGTIDLSTSLLRISSLTSSQEMPLRSQMVLQPFSSLVALLRNASASLLSVNSSLPRSLASLHASWESVPPSLSPRFSKIPV
jgi:acetyl-CoA acetyltransferase